MAVARSGGQWVSVERPGYFGRRRDLKISGYNARFGIGNWRIAWVVESNPATGMERGAFEFNDACERFYDEAYFRWLRDHPDAVETICQYGECMDNDISNLQSGLDYTKQESWATHIQDIAVRNALHRLGRTFNGESSKILVIRSKDTNGYFLSPGRVSFHMPHWITSPSLAPQWAQQGSVEDFWQSNKWIQVWTTFDA